MVLLLYCQFSDEIYFSMQPGHFQGNSYDIVSAFQVSPFSCPAARVLICSYFFYNVLHAASVYLVF